ncbi:MAG TPA: hypothetical protein DDW42_08525 [Desulfobacteraceae bacterium]|nr:hypothetical protein [Desulfobacteraceae bacterium]
MKVEDIRRVLIIGAGAMGQQIGFQCAMHGYDVALYDISPDMLDKARERIKKLCERFVSSGRMTKEQSEKLVCRTGSHDLAVFGVVIVSELISATVRHRISR